MATMKSSLSAVIAYGALGVVIGAAPLLDGFVFPKAALASPCETTSLTQALARSLYGEHYCYRWLSGSNVSKTDYFIVRPLGDKKVSGYHSRYYWETFYGEWSSRGDAEFNNGIVCLGIISTSQALGVDVSEGVCFLPGR